MSITLIASLLSTSSVIKANEQTIKPQNHQQENPKISTKQDKFRWKFCYLSTRYFFSNFGPLLIRKISHWSGRCENFTTSENKLRLNSLGWSFYSPKLKWQPWFLPVTLQVVINLNMRYTREKKMVSLRGD